MHNAVPGQPAGDAPNPESIRSLAHLIWLEDGQPRDNALDHWVTAESILRASLDRYALEERCDRGSP